MQYPVCVRNVRIQSSEGCEMTTGELEVKANEMWVDFEKAHRNLRAHEMVVYTRNAKTEFTDEDVEVEVQPFNFTNIYNYLFNAAKVRCKRGIISITDHDGSVHFIGGLEDGPGYFCDDFDGYDDDDAGSKIPA